MTITVEDFLAHYGVKGMRWGVVNDDATSNSRTKSSKSASTNHQAKGEYLDILKNAPASKSSTKLLVKNQNLFLNKANPSGSKTKGLTPGQKKALYIGAGSLAVAAIIGGAYYAKTRGVDIDFPLAEKYRDQVRSLQSKVWGNDNGHGFYTKSAFERPAFTLPAGQVFNRISTGVETGFRHSTYASFTNDDFARYKEGFKGMSEIMGNEGARMSHVTFSAKRDIRVPDLTTTLETFRESWATIKGSELSKKQALSEFQGISGYSWDENPVSKHFVSSLIKKGYDAIVDDMDAGVVSDTPLIIFNNSAFTEKSNRALTIKEMFDAEKLLKPLANPKG